MTTIVVALDANNERSLVVQRIAIILLVSDLIIVLKIIAVTVMDDDIVNSGATNQIIIK